MVPSVDWSRLPKEMLELILERLNDPMDLLCCPGVCGSWFSVGRQLLPRQLSILPPLLMFPDTKQEEDDRGIVFHNYLTRKQRRISLPEQFCDSWLLGGSHGWITSIQPLKPQEIHLIHAISLAQIRLPNLDSSIPRNRLRLVMSANPLSDPNCMVVTIYPLRKHLEFCRVGDTTWTELSTMVNMAHCSAATFYKGQLHVFNGSDQIIQINFMAFRGPKVVTWRTQGLRDDIRVDRRWYRDDILIESPHYLMESSGDLLLVTYMRGIRIFKVHKLDCSRKVWIEVDDLGDRALFVGYYNSMSVVVPAAANEEDGSCSGFGGCRANTIYFVDDSDCSVENQYRQERRGLYDMKTRQFKEWIPGCGRIWLRSPISWIRPEA